MIALVPAEQIGSYDVCSYYLGVELRLYDCKSIA